MMRVKNFIYLLLLATGVLLASCIREQAQNMEADIETATIANSTEILQIQPIITDNTITFRLREYTTDFHFSPEFTLTPGASIKPASGTKLDFSTPQKYTVTSEDGAWKRNIQYHLLSMTQKGVITLLRMQKLSIRTDLKVISIGFSTTRLMDRKSMIGQQQMRVITFWLKHYWKMVRHLLRPSTLQLRYQMVILEKE